MGATARTADFSNVKEGGNFNKSRIPAGDYLAVIKKVEDAVAKDKTDQYLFTIQIKSRPGTLLPYYCKLADNQLWKLRNIFIAAGKTVPKKKTRVDPNQIVGKLIGVTIEDTEWENKEQSEVAGVFPAAELGDESAVPTSDDDDSDDADDVDDDGADLDDSADEAEEEEETEEEADEEEADPYADLDRATLKSRIKAHQNDAKFRTSQTDDDLRAILKGLDEAGASSDDDDDEEEEAPAPKPAAKRVVKKKAADVTDEDLEDLDIDDL